MANEARVPEVAAPEVELHPDGSPVLKGVNSAQFWPTEAKATEIARARTKGARRAYVVKSKDGKTRYATATHHHFLMQQIMESELGYEITEVGKVSAAKAPLTAAAILAAVDTMPAAERELILKQLEPIIGKKK